MQGIVYGLSGSVLATVVAGTVSSASNGPLDVLWFLLAQFAAVTLSSFRSVKVSIPVFWHILRLFCGLCSFGGSFLAMALSSGEPAKVLIILNAAPVLVVLFSPSWWGLKLGALVAFLGVALVIGGGGAFGWFLLCAAIAAVAYALSFSIVHKMRQLGEPTQQINGIYGVSALVVVLVLILVFKPSPPSSWVPFFVVGLTG